MLSLVFPYPVMADQTVSSETGVGVMYGESNPDTYFHVQAFGKSCYFAKDGEDKARALRAELESRYLDTGAAVGTIHIICNTTANIGSSSNGLFSFSANSDENKQGDVMTHEISHSIGRLGDEYDKKMQGENISDTSDPDKIKWHKMLGFRGIGITAAGTETVFAPSRVCMMRDLGNPFCEVCKMELARRLNNRDYVSRHLFMCAILKLQFRIAGQDNQTAGQAWSAVTIRYMLQNEDGTETTVPDTALATIYVPKNSAYTLRSPDLYGYTCAGNSANQGEINITEDRQEITYYYRKNSEMPFYTEAGQYKIYFKAEKAAFIPTYGEAVLEIEKASTSMQLTAKTDMVKGAGTVDLQLCRQGILEDAGIKVTCDVSRITLEEKETDHWIATLPNETKTYTFTACYNGNGNYTGSKADCKVRVTADHAKEEPGNVTPPSAADTSVSVKNLNV